MGHQGLHRHHSLRDAHSSGLHCLCSLSLLGIHSFTLFCGSPCPWGEAPAPLSLVSEASRGLRTSW